MPNISNVRVYNLEVAKAYITYRYLHNVARSQYDELIKIVSEKLTAKKQWRQN